MEADIGPWTSHSSKFAEYYSPYRLKTVTNTVVSVLYLFSIVGAATVSTIITNFYTAFFVHKVRFATHFGSYNQLAILWQNPRNRFNLAGIVFK